MKKDTQQPVKVIVRKKKSAHAGGGHHHGGSWKIAYADFMTAMMALFLVMWLIGKASPTELQRIADYFRTPLALALSGGENMSNSEAPIPGGGDDYTQKQGEERLATVTEQQLDLKRAELEAARLREVGKKIQESFQLDPRLKSLQQNLIVELTELGLRIQILSDKNEAMFEIGSAKIKPNMQVILHALAPIINTLPNRITLSGHTDERQYPSGDRGYSNWELSADRANASRIELIAGGLDANKIMRVIALADTVGLNNPKYSKDSNRRISILILNKASQEYIENENIMTGIDLLSQFKEHQITTAGLAESVENTQDD